MTVFVLVVIFYASQTFYQIYKMRQMNMPRLIQTHSWKPILQICSVASPINVEQLALASYDFIIIDLEHTLKD